MVRFGPSGNSENFYKEGYKSSVDMPSWLAKKGLNAYEYQCSRGVNIREDTAKKIGEEARKYDIFLSIHAPYYINLANTEHEKRATSKKYILTSMQAAKWMGAKRVVVHIGSCKKMPREQAMKTATCTLLETLFEADNWGLSDISVCPEVLGKINQIGSLDEILELCKIDERLVPTIDFGHIHARGNGNLISLNDYQNIMDKIERVLGSEILKNLHCHFSRVEFSKGGEQKHWTLEDTQFGPEFEPLAEVICKRGIEPVIICESRNNMAEDAVRLKNIYEGIYKI